MQRFSCIKFVKSQLNHQRFYTNAAAKEPVKYTSTINLPKTEFPQRLSAAKRAEVERTINKVKHIFTVLMLMDQTRNSNERFPVECL